MSAARHPIADLPFVADRKKPLAAGEAPRCFWSVTSTGDAWADSAIGNEHGIAYLRFEASRDHNVEPYILPMIIGDMPRELGHIEIAFLTVVGIATASPAGVQRAEHIVDYWRRCREEEAAQKKRRRRPKIRVVKGGKEEIRP